MRRAYPLNAGRALLVLASLSVNAWGQAAAEPLATPLVVDDATRAAVRRLGEEGTSAFVAGDYALASERLEKAFQLMPVPSLGLWSARALVKRGLWTRAAERYLSVRRLDHGPGDPRVQREAQAVAAREEAELAPRIPSLRLTVAGPGAERALVLVDGATVPAALIGERWPVNPGQHVIVATRNDERVESTASVNEGEHLEVVLTLRTPDEPEPALAPLAPATAEIPAQTAVTPAAPPAPALAPAPGSDETRTRPFPWQTIGWATIGVSGATLVVSAVAGVLAKNTESDLDCLGNECTNDSGASKYNTLVDVATVGWISGAALALAGTVMVLAAPRSETSLNVSLGPGWAGVHGRF